MPVPGCLKDSATQQWLCTEFGLYSERTRQVYHLCVDNQAVAACSRAIHHLPKLSADFQGLYLIYGDASGHKRHRSGGNIPVTLKVKPGLSFSPMLWLLYLLRTDYQEINCRFEVTVHSVPITASPFRLLSVALQGKELSLLLPLPFLLWGQIHIFHPKSCLSPSLTLVKSSRRINSMLFS